MGKMFIAFGGTETPAQPDTRFVIEKGYECWKLEGWPFEEILTHLKREIPPLNANIKDENYLTDLFVKTDIKTLYAKTRWGLLLPTPEAGYDHYEEETIHLLNLFSPEFLYPMLVATDFGMRDYTYYHRDRLHLEHAQNQSHLFRDTKFIEFHRLLFDAMSLFQWELDRVEKWSTEDFRILMADYLFNDLKRYHNSKKPWVGGREYADQCVILETLLSRREERMEITYRLKKRIAVLLSSVFPEIEQDIQKLYSQRSDFIHGTTFALIKESGDDFSKLIDFDFARKCTTYLRVLLAVYCHLHQSKVFLGAESVVELLEKAVIDLPLRSKIGAKADEILSLMPL